MKRMKRPKSFGTKLSLRAAQLSVLSQAPQGFTGGGLAFMDETPRAPRAMLNKHEEKRFMDSLFTTCAQYYKTGLKKIWLKKNNNGVALSLNGQHVIKYGLGTGVSDGIGYRVIHITSEMVGKTIAQFTAVEGKLKIGGVISSQQQEFIDQVNRDGGLAFVAYDTDGVQNTIDKIISSSMARSN